MEMASLWSNVALETEIRRWNMWHNAQVSIPTSSTSVPRYAANSKEYSDGPGTDKLWLYTLWYFFFLAGLCFLSISTRLRLLFLANIYTTRHAIAPYRNKKLQGLLWMLALLTILSRSSNGPNMAQIFKDALPWFRRPVSTLSRSILPAP